jgi:hypothetical protein
MPIDPQVADALGFSERELAANRSGTLSPAQRADVRRQVVVAFGLELFMLGLLTLVVVADIRLVTKIIACAVPLALAVVGVQGLWQTIGDLVRPRVLSVQGPVKFVPQRGSTDPGVLVVGSFGHTLDRGSSVPDLMKAGENCRAYFLAASRTFLSLERLPPESPASELQ